MKYRHDKPKPAKVREPVQVYLDAGDQEMLERLTRRLETSKSDVLRRALGALERELTEPTEHPALRLIGIAGDPSTRPEPPDLGYDVVIEHDRFLAESEMASWEDPSSRDER